MALCPLRRLNGKPVPYDHAMVTFVVREIGAVLLDVTKQRTDTRFWGSESRQR
jgi:hypothetical protein